MDIIAFESIVDAHVLQELCLLPFRLLLQQKVRQYNTPLLVTGFVLQLPNAALLD
jgi:hypothetical protein